MMTALERTVYRRFQRTYTAKELSEIFTPTHKEIWFVAHTSR